MGLKELIFGGNVQNFNERDGAYSDSVQKWLPIQNVINGVIVTKDRQFIKVLEVLPVNFYLKSPIDQQNIIYQFASYLKIAPDTLQILIVTQKADTVEYIAYMRRCYEEEEVDGRYGPITTTAIKQFQAAVGYKILQPTGYADADTLMVLFSEDAPRNPALAPPTDPNYPEFIVPETPVQPPTTATDLVIFITPDP